jgi:hypothetical protein
MIVVTLRPKKDIIKLFGRIKKGPGGGGREGFKSNGPQRPRGKKEYSCLWGVCIIRKNLRTLIKSIAEEIDEVKSRGGKIAVVGGPQLSTPVQSCAGRMVCED